jgi:Bacterial regulatory proteins, luxR family
VLSLLRDGLSNREIADRLGISLSGAKYHVSEIISKLGVSSREAAAAWDRPDRRHWILLPAFLSQKRGLPSVGLTLKLAIGTVAVSPVAAIAFAVGASGSGTDDAALAASQPSPTPDFPCPRPGESCFRILHVELASWDEAASYATAPLLEPKYVPGGYERDRLTYSYSYPVIERRGVYTSLISADFVDPDGHDLIVNQGFGPSLEDSGYHLAPDEYRGSLVVNGAKLHWTNGNSIWEERPDGWHATDEWDVESLSNYTLTWEEPRTGPIVWERSPDGKVTYSRGGDAVGYLIYATGLPLEELIKIAESMLQD